MLNHPLRLAALLGLLAAPGSFAATLIPINNPSFESPTTLFAGPDITGWSDAPNPFGSFGVTDEQWNQATGVYLNAPGTQFHANGDGNQAAFITMSPLVEIFQDLTAPEAKFTIGQSYQLSVGVIGAGGGMPDGTTMRMSLYYRDATNAKAIVGSFNIVMSQATFPDRGPFRYFNLDIPAVLATDAWAGKAIGIQFASLAQADSGYYDIENVRLTAVPEPAATALLTGGALLLAARRRRARHACAA